MSKRFRVRGRLTCGNIQDPELHQERIADLKARREASLSVLYVVIGVAAFIVVMLAL